MKLFLENRRERMGDNLIQSVFTNWCLAETVLVKLGVKNKAEAEKCPC